MSKRILLTAIVTGATLLTVGAIALYYGYKELESKKKSVKDPTSPIPCKDCEKDACQNACNSCNKNYEPEDIEDFEDVDDVEFKESDFYLDGDSEDVIRESKRGEKIEILDDFAEEDVDEDSVDECMCTARKKADCPQERKNKISLSEIKAKDPLSLTPEEKLIRAIFDTDFDYSKYLGKENL